jgi:hypothetical protein
LSKHATLVAAVQSRGDHHSVLGLGAATAGLGASRPGKELGELAILGAFVRVAFASFSGSGALLATSAFLYDTTVVHLLAGAT